ncbi:unnamed protein product [Sphagnum tenellum]
MYELRMCPRSFFGTIVFAAWEKIFHLDYQQRFPPFSNFCDHIESLWHDPRSIVWQAGKKHCDCFDTHSEWNPSLGLQTGENSAHYVRRIISSAELGLVLIGSLRDSGKLQLVDATGALDVMIPDLQCFANLSSTYQIASFNLVVEGKWRTSTHSAEANGGRLPNSPVACSTLLKGLVFKMEPSNLLSYYVHFQIQHASCLKNLVWPSRETCTSNPSWLRKFNQIESHEYSWKGRQFELLMVTHKHPVRLKPGVEAGEGNQWTLSETFRGYDDNTVTDIYAHGRSPSVAQLLSVREALDCASHPAKTVSDSLSNHEEASENKSDPGIGANSAGILQYREH